MAVGFEFSEALKGSYHLLSDPGTERPMSVTVRAQVHNIRKFLLDPTAEASGEIEAEGLADHRPLRGSLEINPLLKRKLVYELFFDDADGLPVRFYGEKDIDALRIVSAITTLPASLFRDDVEFARAVLRFRPREDLVRFLKSLRPR